MSRGFKASVMATSLHCIRRINRRLPFSEPVSFFVPGPRFWHFLGIPYLK